MYHVKYSNYHCLYIAFVNTDLLYIPAACKQGYSWLVSCDVQADATLDCPLCAGIAKTTGSFGSGFGNFGFGNTESSGDTASRGMKAAKPSEQESSANSWAAF